VYNDHNPTLIVIGLFSPNHLFFIMHACLGHILESSKWIEMKPDLYIDDSERKGNVQEPYSYCVYLQSNLPITILFIMDACPGHIL